MFQFITLGVFLLSGTGVLVAGTGGYIVLQNKDLIKTTVVEQNDSSSSHNTELPPIFKEFKEQLKSSKETSEKLSNLEKDLINLESQQILLTSAVESLDAKIKNKTQDVENWGSLIKTSTEEIAELTKQKVEKQQEVNDNKSKLDDKNSEVKAQKDKLTKINEELIKKEKSYNDAVSQKDMAEQALAQHTLKLSSSQDDLKKINLSISSLSNILGLKTTVIQQKQTSIDNNTKDTKTKNDEIKEKINNYVASLNSDISTLTTTDIPDLNSKIKEFENQLTAVDVDPTAPGSTQLTPEQKRNKKIEINKNKTPIDNQLKQKQQEQKDKTSEKTKFENIDSQADLFTFFNSNKPTNSSYNALVTTFISDMQELKDSLAKLTQDKDLLESEKRGLNTTHDDLIRQRDAHPSIDVSNNASGLNDAVAEKQRIYDSTKEELDKQKAEKQTNAKKLNDLESHAIQKQKDLEKSTNEFNKLQKSFDDETKNNKYLTNQKSTAENTLSSIKEKKTQEKDKIDTNTKNISNKKQEITNHKEKKD